MANSIFAIRSVRMLPTIANRVGLTQRSSFHSSVPLSVRIGDRIPDIDVLVEGSPGNKINLAQEVRGKKSLIIGVPAAFSPACSNSHLPGYINHKNLEKAGDIFVVSVNDPFVTKAWGVSLDPAGKSGIRFLGDPTGKFTEALDLLFDSTAIFGNARSKRYALVVEDGTVKKMYIEPDNTGVDVTTAKNVLG